MQNGRKSNEWKREKICPKIVEKNVCALELKIGLKIGRRNREKQLMLMGEKGKMWSMVNGLKSAWNNVNPQV